jgi:dipeptidyl aminopeptidase/acylaminoacyl peptidase
VLEHGVAAVAPHGSWTSPISVDLLAGAAVSLGYVDLAEDGLYWIEGRPQERGRSVLVFCPDGGEPVDVVPPDFNARTRVHEYGGGAYWRHGQTVFCSSFDDSRIYRFDRPGSEPRAVTPEPPQAHALRYADGVVTPDGSTVVCVRERHHRSEVLNELVAFPVDGSAEPRVIGAGRDFYAAPRLDPDGRQIAWIAWDHPHMPFDASDVCVADFAPDGSVTRERRVAGGENESVLDPAWSPDGSLHFVSDRSGWWNLYAERGGQVEALCPTEAEFAQAFWVFGLSQYAFLPDGRIACVVTHDAQERLEILDPRTRTLTPLDLPYTTYSRSSPGAREGLLAFCAAGPTSPTAIVTLDLADLKLSTVRQSVHLDVDTRYFSLAESIDFPGADGETAHAFFYPPANPDYEAPTGELPPLVVSIHGGPTDHVTNALHLEIQFFTSRGLGVVDVNYGGSTGYGRKYRRRLDGRWGQVDLGDAVGAVHYLADAGCIDRMRVAITGGSAGGYTTLLALALTREFAAGMSAFGIADLELLARATEHKFEAHYEHSLVGPYPERADLYRERSPITHADQISAPLLILQGLEDKVVPPAQADAIIEALRRRGIPYAYLAFEGEGHGFRRADSRRRMYEGELSFLGQVFGFEPADDLEPVQIENLEPVSRS